eukprot:g3544.t1
MFSSSSSPSSCRIVAAAFCDADVTGGEVFRSSASYRARLSFERALLRFGPSDWIVRAVVPLEVRTSGQAKSDVVHAAPARVVAVEVARSRAVWLRRVVEEVEGGVECTTTPREALVVAPPRGSSSSSSSCSDAFAYLLDRVEISRAFFDAIDSTKSIGLVTVLAHRVAVEYPCAAILRALRLFASDEARVPRRLRRSLGDLLGGIGMRERVAGGGGDEAG